MLRRTELDLQGEALRLPFPSFAFVFDDAETLEQAGALARVDPTCRFDAGSLRTLTVYVTQVPPDGAHLGLSLSFVMDGGAERWPYLLWRMLYVRAEDSLDRIIDSTFPDISPASRDPIFASPELRALVKLAINAILYATSADVERQRRESKVRALRRSAKGRGEKKKGRTESRVRELLGQTDQTALEGTRKRGHGGAAVPIGGTLIIVDGVHRDAGGTRAAALSAPNRPAPDGRGERFAGVSAAAIHVSPAIARGRREWGGELSPPATNEPSEFRNEPLPARVPARSHQA